MRGFLIVLGIDQRSDARVLGTGDAHDDPSRIRIHLGLTARGQELHLVDHGDRTTGQGHRLGCVALEAEPELSSALQRIDAPAKFLGRGRVAFLHACEERSQLVAHSPSSLSLTGPILPYDPTSLG